MSKISKDFAEHLKERYIISEALKKNTFSGAVAVDASENLSIMINEEDHIRAQCILKGEDLCSAYRKIAQLDKWMDNNLRYCKREGIGYITACPTNVGTGMRASAMMFLPALTKSKMIQNLYEKAKPRGLTVRGVFGEGSSGESCLYQVSNEVTLGKSESSIITEVEKYVKEVASIEQTHQLVYYNENRLAVSDKVYRALGILTYCRKLSYAEFSSLIADFKMGVMLGIVKVKEVTAIDDLLVTARQANLILSMGDAAQSADNDAIDGFRAEYVRNCLKKILV